MICNKNNTYQAEYGTIKSVSVRQKSGKNIEQKKCFPDIKDDERMCVQGEKG